MKKLLQPRFAAWLDLSVITLVGGILAFLVLTSQTYADLNIPDYPWYLNRATLIWQGVLGQFFVYTFTYPFVVGAVDLVIRDRVTSSIVVHLLAMEGLLIGVYLLGRIAYNRTIALVAVLLLASNVWLYVAARELQTFVPFMSLSIWCLIAAYFAVKRPGVISGVLVGVVITLCFYTRFEGVMFGLLIPLVTGTIFFQTRRWRKSLQPGLMGGLIAGTSLLFYLFILASRASDTRVTGISNFWALFVSVPPQTRLIAWRVSDLITFSLGYWPVWAWVAVLFAVTQWSDRYRRSTLFFLGMLGTYLVVVMFVAPWPSERIDRLVIPFLALPLAWALVSLGKRVRLAALVGIMALAIPGGVRIATYVNTTAPLTYRQGPQIAWGADLETWLHVNGQDDSTIFTFCGDLIPYTHADMRYIYRLGFVPENDPNLIDSPSNVIPKLATNNGLLMVCPDELYFGDWIGYFIQQNIAHNPASYVASQPVPEQLAEDYQLELAHTVGPFRFYRIISHEN